MKNTPFLGWVAMGAIAFTLWLFFPFLKSFFVALLLSMAFYPLYQMVQRRFKQQKYGTKIAPISSVALITLTLATLIFLPISLFLYHLLNNPIALIEAVRHASINIDTYSTHLPSTLAWLQDPLNTLLLQAKSHSNDIIAFLMGWLQNGFKLFASMIGEMIMIILFFFFLMLYGERINLFLLPIIPLTPNIKREFLAEMTKTTAVVFYTFIGVMIAQGLAFGIFIAFFQGYNPLLLGFLTAFTALIPIVGTALVWVPVALNEYFIGHTLNAVIIALYSWAMMAFFIDNIVKLVILNFVNKTIGNGKRRLNDFLIFFAIVGGLATFGFWAVILGPAIVAFTITTLRVLRGGVLT